MSDVSTKNAKIVKDQSGRARKELAESALAAMRERFPNVPIESSDLSEAIATLSNHFTEKFTTLEQSYKDIVPADQLDADGIKKHPAFQDAWKAQMALTSKEVEAIRLEAEQAKKDYMDKAAQIEMDSRANDIRSMVISGAAKLNIALADQVKEPELYEKQINGLLALPAFHPTRWAKENGKLVPLSQDNTPRQDKNFNPMDGLDVLAEENLYGIRKFDASKSSPSATSAAGGSRAPISMEKYQAEKKALLAKGDRAGAAALARRYAAQADK